MAVAGSLAAASSAFAGPVFEHVSVSSSEKPGNDTSFGPDVTADGRYVVFQSTADNLARHDRDHVYLRDRRGGRTRIVSRNSQGKPGNEYSILPAISPNGRYVAFCSGATNLVQPDRWRRIDPHPQRHPNVDVFVRDLATGETRRPSTGYQGGMADGYSCYPAVANDGDVLFLSWAGNLVRRDRDRRRDAFVYDWGRDRLKMLGVPRQLRDAKTRPYVLGLSADGSTVVARIGASWGDGDVADRNFVFLRRQGRWERIPEPDRPDVRGHCVEQADFHVSRRGRYVLLQCAYLHPESDGTHTMGPQHLYRYDRRRDRLVRATPPPETGDGPTGDSAAMSPGGRYVTWCSVDSYGRADDPGTHDLFMVDMGRDVWQKDPPRRLLRGGAQLRHERG